MEGIDFIEFNKKKITAKVAGQNYAFWKAKHDIPSVFNEAYGKTLTSVKKVYGAHTFAFRTSTPSGVVYPLLKIFSFNESTKRFESKKCGVVCDKIRKGDGAHMSLARKLGLDKFVFSYLGMHLPYHRKDDVQPIFPFGLFVRPAAFAKMHGSPCDRNFERNDEVDKVNIDKYFLLPEDLQKLITHRIITDPLFSGNFWKYYGSPEYWEDEQYREEQWKKKGEYCHYEEIKPDDIGAILWPVWEENVDDDLFLPSNLFNLIPSFEDAFNIKVIVYRPYGGVINGENWENMNMRDWEISLVEASHLAHRYFDEQGVFPDSIKTVKEYLKSKTAWHQNS